MAKAGFWLRGANGKLAGASIGKGANGATIMREIVTPRNPKTDKQLYQRAVMSSVMLAYSAGKEIFDHAFEGFPKGAECQRRFISLNSRLLRSAASVNFTDPDDPQASIARLVGPKSVSFVPWNFRISEGSYPQALFKLTEEDQIQQLNPFYSLPAVTTGQTVADYAQANNLIPGDIYTIVIMANDAMQLLCQVEDELTSNYSCQFAASFGFVRLIVKNGLTATDELTTIGQLFEVEKTPNIPISIATLPMNTQFNVELFEIAPYRALMGKQKSGAIGVIRSRFDQDLRSTSNMVICDFDENYLATKGFGLSTAYVLQAWRQGDILGQSQLILEGGDENF